jgi:chromosome segregation ATPase
MSALPNRPSDNEPQTATACQTSAFSGIDRNLGLSAREDSEAMQDDLSKAAEVTACLEGALAGKSREVAHLKRLLEESSARFKRLQETITAIRNERHSLANTAMRVTGLEAALKQMTMERDRLKLERDGVLEGLADEAAGNHLLRFDRSHIQIVELTVQVVKLKGELADLKRELDRYTRTSNPKTAAPENFGPGTG